MCWNSDLLELFHIVSSKSLNAGLLCLQRFSAVIMRIRDPKTTALMFASGKVVGFSQTLATSQSVPRRAAFAKPIV